VTERGQRPVGSVAEETARLLDALLSGDGLGDGTRRDVPEGDVSPIGRTDPGQEGADRPSAEVPPAHRAAAPSDPSAEAPSPCSSCGQVAGGGEESACHLCPVCQLVTAVRWVNPETVDRLADLAAAVSQTLRDVAANRWAKSGRPAARRQGAPVEDIDVGEDDEPEKTVADLEDSADDLEDSADDLEDSAADLEDSAADLEDSAADLEERSGVERRPDEDGPLGRRSPR